MTQINTLHGLFRTTNLDVDDTGGAGRPTRRRLRRALAIAVAVPALLLGMIPAAGAAAPPAQLKASAGSGIVQRAVSFTVKNVNGTGIACQADGATYTVRGHITGTAQSLADPQTVTLLEHGLSYGEFFGNSDIPGYNFADDQAQAGHVTVTVDRLGYGSSDKPVGENICFGSRADIAHQEVLQLKAGSYTTTGANSAKFAKVVLAGHSVGAIIAQTEAYTFGDIDGLMVLSYSDTDVGLGATAALAIATQQCQAGGMRQHGDSGPTGYVWFGADTPEKFIEAHFYTPGADPGVVAQVAAMRSEDPCGDILSYKKAVAADLANIGKITVPTLVLTGGKDAIYPVPADKQAALLTDVHDITAVTIPDTGHALTFHYSQDQFQAKVSTWLVGHGFGGWAMPVGAPDTGGGSAAATDHQTQIDIGVLLLLVAAGTLLWTKRRRAGHLS